MPKRKAFSKGAVSNCRKCGKVTRLTVKEHGKRVHQMETKLHFGGKAETVICRRGADGMWRCPRCSMSFADSPRNIQDHARRDGCSEFPPLKKRRHVGQSDAHSSGEDGSDAQHIGRMSSAELSNTDSQSEECLHDDGGAEPKLGNLHSEATTSHAEETSSSASATTNTQGAGLEDGCGRAGSGVSSQRVQLSDPLDPKPHDYPSLSSLRALFNTSKASTKHPHKEQTFVALTITERPFTWAELDSPPTSENQLTTLDPPEADTNPGSINFTDCGQSGTMEQVPAPRTEAAGQPQTGTAVLSTPSLPSMEPGTSQEATSNPAIPPALRAFLNSLRISCENLADIFVENGFDTDESLDFLSELPVHNHWEAMQKAILREGRLAGWLAVQKGLERRAQSLRAAAL